MLLASRHVRLGTSDHHPVFVTLNVPLYRDKIYKRKVWQYEEADYWGMRLVSSHQQTGLVPSNLKTQKLYALMSPTSSQMQ